MSDIYQMLEEMFRDVPENEKRDDLKEIAEFLEANKHKSLSQLVNDFPEMYPQFNQK